MRKKVLAVVSAALFTPAPAFAERLDPPPQVISVPVASIDSTTTDYCGPPSSSAVPDGRPIVVQIPPVQSFTVGSAPSSWWRTPPASDPTWQLTFRGFVWAKPIAKRAHVDGQLESLSTIAGQVVQFHQQNPDDGTSDNGWGEGTAMKRLDAENCLYSLMPTEGLRSGMIADANVLLGSRYYGPPRTAVHNHGLMANIQLFRAGTLLGMDGWKSVAVRRMLNEAALAFSAKGVTVEQSSEYQLVNILLWRMASDYLRESGYDVPANSLDQTLARAAAAFRWMTEPDGRLVQIGDSTRRPGDPYPAYTSRVLRDDATGWIVGRWSWNASNTTYYTVRYGPARRAHGHHDRAGGVTWSTDGVRVLVGPGKFNYDGATNWFVYQRGPRSHNVAVPQGRPVTDNGGSVTASLVQAPAHTWGVKDRMFGMDHSRTINVNRATRTIRVSDQFAGASWWHQYWHLDPSWQLASRASTRLTFSHPSGKRLVVRTTGRVSNVVAGVTSPVQGWNFPQFGSKVAAPEIVIRSFGGSSVTSLTVE